ncbi:MAG: tetratricopeptide repeat protein [Myxococcota bacterium]|nr:tetratricopeptide repeat protein [Myxococcota bacterium]MEC9388460.1 tetratricopeptide repeat protein [Myxococcota bacterium]
MDSRCALVACLLAAGCTSVHRIPAPEPAPPAGAPTHALSMYMRGMVMVASGDLDSARTMLRQARVYDPDSSAILLALAKVETTAGDIDAARHVYKHAASALKTNPDAWLEWGRLELAFGDPNVGRDALRTAERLGDPWQARARLIADALHRGVPPEGLDLWSGRTVTDPTERRVRAELRVKAGDALGGVEDYLELIAMRGADHRAVEPLVQAAVNRGGLVTALTGAEEILDHQPHSTGAMLVVGLLSGFIGDHTRAADALDAASAMGVALNAPTLRVRQRARAAAEHPPAPKPTATPPLGDPISRSVLAVDEGRWGDATEAIEQGLAAAPRDARLLYIRSQMVMKRDGPAAALAPAEAVLRVHPTYAPALNLWAWIQSQTHGDLEEADRRIRAALEQQPRIGAYWDTFGWIAHLRGDRPLAQQSLERAARLAPEDETIRAHLRTCCTEKAL